MKNKRLIVLIGLFATVLLGAGAIFYFQNRSIRAAEGASPEEECPFRSKLDGDCVESVEAESPRVVAAMIDNHPDARPQSGLSQARVVYEAPVEGGLTRYMALFAAGQDVKQVGPVRSSRPYYLDWLQEYGAAPYLHCGGSPEALSLLKTAGLFDVNQFWWDQYFWRSRQDFAPHNLYTSSSLWQDLLVDRGSRFPEQAWEGWKFDSTKQLVDSAVSTTTISYAPGYAVSWHYDSAQQKYFRLVNNRAYFDRDGMRVAADTVIIEKMKVEVIDAEGRRKITTLGEGSALVLKRGLIVDAVWKKSAARARTELYDVDGHEITLTPGQTWVQIVPEDVKIETEN